MATPDTDQRRHGTGVAGIIVGGEPWISSVHGVAPDADLLMIDFSTPLDAEPLADYFAGFMTGAKIAADEGAQVLIHEFGVRVGQYHDGSSEYEGILDALHAGGMTQVTMAHNFANNGGDTAVMIAPGESVTLDIVSTQGGVNPAIFLLWSLRWADATFLLDATLTDPLGNERSLMQGEQWDGSIYVASRTSSGRGS